MFSLLFKIWWQFIGKPQCGSMDTFLSGHPIEPLYDILKVDDERDKKDTPTVEFDWFSRDKDSYVFDDSDVVSKFNFKSNKLKNCETIRISNVPDNLITYLVDIKEQVPRSQKYHSDLWKVYVNFNTLY
jgi:hypothetical protein